MITDQVSKLPSLAIFGGMGQLAMNLVALMCFSVGVSAQIADWSVVTEGASGDPLTYGSGQYVGQSKHNAVVDAEGNTIAAHPAGNDRNYDALIVKHGPDGTVVW